jgi:hypothetical protein
MVGKCLISFALLVFLPVGLLSAETMNIRTKDANIVFEESLSGVAREVARVYPSISLDLERIFMWEADFRPEIELVRDKRQFRDLAGSDIIVAYAVPDRNLIVLDTSRIYAKPFTLETTLKHETCHLLLHRHIAQDRLPRWLDEGICQWASGGIAELLSGEEEGIFAKAVISDSLIDIQKLSRFPADEKNLILAYQESKSIVQHIVAKFGSRGLLALLENLRRGETVQEAVREAFSMSLPELEKDWQASVKRKHTWFIYFSDNIYAVIFTLTAIITIYGFIRLVKKRRAYKDEDEGEDERGQGPFE